MRSTVVFVVFGLLAAACTETTETTTTLDTPSSTASSGTTTSAEVGRSFLNCLEGSPKQGLDLGYEGFFPGYRNQHTQRLVNMFGDGPVFDPWLDPEGPSEFENLEAWVAAGGEVDDRFSNHGYGYYEPFHIYATRENDILDAAGVEEMTVTIQVWANQDCERRMEVRDPVTSPDPCAVDAVFPDSGIDVCNGPFDPIAGHLAVWTGTEVLVVGGYSGALGYKPELNGYAFDPDAGTIRDVAPIPAEEDWSPAEMVWADGRALLVGSPLYRDDLDDYTPTIYEYDAEADSWSELTQVAGNDTAIGSVVWTGSELLMFGGENNAWSSEIKSYSPRDDAWAIPDFEIEKVEDSAGVWTGSEALFLGGYAHEAVDTFMTARYTPSDGWTTPAPPELPWVTGHELLWTGSEVALVGGNAGPGHFGSIPLYDPATDTWRMSPPHPIPPRERFDAVWTGAEILIWGGYDTYGDSLPRADGAAYNPATDTWRLLSPSPLGPRCDHSATWTGEVLVVIGGVEGCGSPGQISSSDGAIYDPSSDTWTLIEG